MKQAVLGSLLAAVVALPAFAALKEGDKAPDFKAEASLAGKEFTYSLRDARKKGPVVVYFYPAAFSGGCNIQAHTFAVEHDKFAAAGQDTAKMKNTRGEEIGHAMTERTTFVVAADGKIVATIGGIAADKNVEQALTVVQGLATKQTARN
jgi:peroxiredoxin